jgi:hypothetical protein
MAAHFNRENIVSFNVAAVLRHPARLQLLLGQRKKPNSPTKTATPPPMKSQTVLSVGEPVKNRDTPELMESEALKPQMINMIPTANSAMEITRVFMWNAPLRFVEIATVLQLTSWGYSREGTQMNQLYRGIPPHSHGSAFFLGLIKDKNDFQGS